MTATTSTTDLGSADVAGDRAGVVLAEARRHQAAAQAADAALLDTACRWADLHPAPSRALAAHYTCGRDQTPLLLAGAGAPWIDAMAVAELAAALHLTTEAGQRLIGEALELRHRLPRLWRLVHTGHLPAWHARRVAARTLDLTADTAAYVDRHVVVHAGRIGPVLLDRLITDAITRHMPVEAHHRQAQQAERRCFTLDHRPGDDGLTGQSHLYGVLDLTDALDLDAAITQGARHLADLGDRDPLDVRRARAAGDLARHQPCLHPDNPDTDDHHSDRDHSDRDHGGSPAPAPGPAPAPRGKAPRRVAPRPVVLYLHLSHDALTTPGSASEAAHAVVGRVQNTQTPVLASQIRDWLGQPDTHLVVKPVIDLRDTLTVDAYEIPDRIREHLTLRHPTCVFPWCHRTSTRCDLDHITPYDPDGPPGQTSTTNLAPLCRRHHRLKTHTGWTYRAHDRPGHYRWTSPHGLTFHRDPTGTHQIT